MVVVVTDYSGELVWRERSLKLDGVYDALPVRNLRPADLAQAVALSAAVGWNQVEADWRVLASTPETAAQPMMTASMAPLSRRIDTTSRRRRRGAAAITRSGGGS